MGDIIDSAVDAVKGVVKTMYDPVGGLTDQFKLASGMVDDITGVSDAEKAAAEAAAQQISRLDAGEQLARADLSRAYDPSKESLQQGFSDARGDINTATGKTIGALNNGYQGAQSALNSGFDSARGDYTNGFGQALSGLNNAQAGIEAPMQNFYNEGAGASQVQAALSGALGPQAQAQAFQNYQESPEVAYMREMGEKSALRGAASQGMSLSGSVLAELNRRGTGLAMQGFGDTMARLGSIANRGQAAGNSLAQARGNLATNTANLQTQQGQGLANMNMQLGQGLANIQNQQGQSLANTYQQQGTNLANISSGQGQALSGLRSGLGQNLANISTQNATNQAQVMGQLGAAQANAALASGQNLMQMGGLLGAALICDERLKDNIRFYKNVDGINLYSFNYKFAPNVKSIGPIAQEHPHACEEIGGVLVIMTERL